MSSSALTLIRDTLQARIGIWKCWVLRRGENRSTRGKTSRSREENLIRPFWIKNNFFILIETAIVHEPLCSLHYLMQSYI